MADRTLTAPSGARFVTDRDAMALISLIGGVYAEYPGCVLDLEGIDDDLVAPGTVAQERDSPWWVIDSPTGGLAASVGVGPRRDDGSVELKRLYVAAPHRRRGLASQLVGWVETHAVEIGATSVELWSDTRFRDAHRLYERLGYRRTGAQRELHDPSVTLEWQFMRYVGTERGT